MRFTHLHLEKKYQTNKTFYNHIDEVSNIDLMDMGASQPSNYRVYRCILLVIDNFSIYTWCLPLKNKYGQSISDEFSKNRTTSSRRPVKTKNDRGKRFS